MPTLRFPEFNGEWAKTKLGKIGRQFDYGMNVPAKEFDGTNKYIRITDIDEASSLYIEDGKVSPAGVLSDNYLVGEGDILFARTGASTGKTYLYKKSDGKLYFAGFLIRVNVPHEIPYFVFSQLHAIRYWKWVRIMSARSGQPGINSQEYASFTVYLPPLPEQRKIASLLRLIDERIATQNKIIEKLQSLIKGIVERNSSCAKANTQIADCFECHTSTLKESQISEIGQYPIYGATGICGYTDEIGTIGSSVLIIKDGSGVGTLKYANGNHGFIATLNQLTAKNGYDLKYLHFALQAFNFEPYKTGMAIPHIYFKDYGAGKLYCPAYEEQTKIAHKLSSIEAKIETEQHLLQLWEQEKSYLLTQMFI